MEELGFLFRFVSGDVNEKEYYFLGFYGGRFLINRDVFYFYWL